MVEISAITATALPQIGALIPGASVTSGANGTVIQDFSAVLSDADFAVQALFLAPYTPPSIQMPIAAMDTIVSAAPIAPGKADEPGNVTGKPLPSGNTAEPHNLAAQTHDTKQARGPQDTVSQKPVTPQKVAAKDVAGPSLAISDEIDPVGTDAPPHITRDTLREGPTKQVTQSEQEPENSAPPALNPVSTAAQPLTAPLIMAPSQPLPQHAWIAADAPTGRVEFPAKTQRKTYRETYRETYRTSPDLGSNPLSAKQTPAKMAEQVFKVVSPPTTTQRPPKAGPNLALPLAAPAQLVLAPALALPKQGLVAEAVVASPSPALTPASALHHPLGISPPTSSFTPVQRAFSSQRAMPIPDNTAPNAAAYAAPYVAAQQQPVEQPVSSDSTRAPSDSEPVAASLTKPVTRASSQRPAHEPDQFVHIATPPVSVGNLSPETPATAMTPPPEARPMQLAPAVLPATTSTVMTQALQDVSALVDRIAEARAAAAPHTIRAALMHEEFGAVSLNFKADAAHINVTLGSADPDFSSAAQAAVAAFKREGFADENLARREALAPHASLLQPSTLPSSVGQSSMGQSSATQSATADTSTPNQHTAGQNTAGRNDTSAQQNPAGHGPTHARQASSHDESSRLASQSPDDTAHAATARRRGGIYA